MASRLVRAVHAVEDSLAFLSIFLLAVDPPRRGSSPARSSTPGIPDSAIYVEHLVLVATFIAAAITSREKKHLALATVLFLPGPVKSFAERLDGGVAVGA